MPSQSIERDVPDAPKGMSQPAFNAGWRACEAENERLRFERDGLAQRIVERVRHCSDVLDANEVSRTSRTLHRMALIIEAEFLPSPVAAR